MRRLLVVSGFIVVLSLLIGASPASAKLPGAKILLFHHIDHHRGRWHVTPQYFEKELAYLSSAGYHSISMDTYMDAAEGKTQLPDRAIVITFDDGYADVFQNAFPLLQKYGMTATFYIITGGVGTAPYMSWDQITQLQKAGMEIGSHTVDHVFLTRMSPLRAYAELLLSRMSLEAHLGTPIKTFAYPFNDRNSEVIALTRMAGYRDAVVVGPHRGDVWDDPFEIHRITVFDNASVRVFESGAYS